MYLITNKISVIILQLPSIKQLSYFWCLNPADLKSNNQIIPWLFSEFSRLAHACDVPSAAGKLGIWKSLHSADRNIVLYWFCQEKRWSEHCCVSCGFTLLWHYIPPTSLWSACGTLYYNIINIFWKIKQFLTNLCDFIKYIMQCNRIWETEKLQLASSYTWQLMRWMQHFYLNITVNHYWVFVITSDCDPIWILAWAALGRG